MTDNRVFSKTCFGFVTPVCFNIQSARKGFVTLLCYFLRFMSSNKSSQRNAVWYRIITRPQYVLVCFAFCSTPARSCSEELFHHSTTLAANAAATPTVAASPVITAGKHPPVMEQEEAAVTKGATGVPLVAEQDEKLARQMLISPKHITTQSPPHFLPVPTTMATATTATTDTGRRKGRALSESDDPQGGNSWLASSLPTTWAPSSNYTTFYEFSPR